MRALAVGDGQAPPAAADAPNVQELGVSWIDGAFAESACRKSTPAALRKRMSDLWAALNNDPEMKELAAEEAVSSW